VRLFPVQIAFVGFLFVLTLTTKLHLSSCQYLTAITYTKNYACGAWVDGHLWSLSVEEQFYLLWPLALLLLPLRGIFTMGAILVALAAPSRAIEYHLGARNFVWLTSNADALMIGSMCAVLFMTHRNDFDRVLAWHPRAMRAVAVGLMFVPGALSHRLLFAKFTVMFGGTLEALCAAYLILSLVARRDGLAFRLLNLRAVAFIGVLSYSLYIWQEPFFAPLGTYGSAGDWILSFPLNLVLVTAASLLSFVIIEMPFAVLRRRLRRKSRCDAEDVKHPTQACPTAIAE
jgi:peptidoglycan/LPS O-acetylase OafA/YrhL